MGFSLIRLLVLDMDMDMDRVVGVGWFYLVS